MKAGPSSGPRTSSASPGRPQLVGSAATAPRARRASPTARAVGLLINGKSTAPCKVASSDGSSAWASPETSTEPVTLGAESPPFTADGDRLEVCCAGTPVTTAQGGTGEETVE